MSKKLFSLAALAMSLAFFTACTDDDTPAIVQPVNPTPVPETPTTKANGVFIINSGSMYNSIPGSITYYDINSGTAAQNVFSSYNGRTIGMTPNAGVVYGTKFYVAVDGEDRVEVIDLASHFAFNPISTTALMGAAEGHSPRHVLAHDGLIYVTTYGGYVAAIDTVDYSLKASYKVGSYPEGMAILDGTLYVACSDYGMGTAPSVAAIDLQTGTVTTITDENINNPSQVVAAEGKLYIVDGDLYDNNWNVAKAGGLRVLEGQTVTPITVDNMAMGTDMVAAYEGKLYIVADAFSGAPNLKVFNCADGAIETKALAGVATANSINVDPASGDIYVTSYTMNEETGYANYSAPGFVARYNQAVELLGTFDAGLNPTGIVFYRQ